MGGQRVTVVRIEDAVKSGPLYKNRMKYVEWLDLKSNTNPRHGGPYHFKAPAQLFWRILRGMVRHKTSRGKAALEKLRVYEGCPHPYSHRKRVMVPAAVRCLRLKNGRKYTRFGDLCAAVGWKKNDLVNSLEEKRKERAGQYFARKLKLMNAVKKQAMNTKECKALKSQLEKLGY